MTEDFLQFIWEYRLLNNPEKLVTTSGKKLQIIHPGTKNFNQGPDFLNAKIKIGILEWNGNMEIHKNSSDWFLHKHQKDERYQNIILHVVYHNDKEIIRKNGEKIPTLELKNYVEKSLFKKYESLQQSKDFIPCQSQILKVKKLAVKNMLERVLVERIERKSVLYKEWLLKNNNDWEQTTFEIIAYCLGLKLNANQMQKTAEVSPIKILQKYADNPFQISAILFGNAGFLNDEKDHFQKDLAAEYKFLKHKHQFNNNLSRSEWNFFRMRPKAFPQMKLDLLSQLVTKSSSFYGKIKSANSEKMIKEIFEVIHSEYWKIHSDFGKKSVHKNLKIGTNTSLNLIINGVIPILYLIYKNENNPEYLNRIFNLLESLKAEENSTIKGFKSLVDVETAFDSQAILELFNYYCSPKKCLSCMIGKQLLVSNGQ